MEGKVNFKRSKPESYAQRTSHQPQVVTKFRRLRMSEHLKVLPRLQRRGRYGWRSEHGGDHEVHAQCNMKLQQLVHEGRELEPIFLAELLFFVTYARTRFSVVWLE